MYFWVDHLAQMSAPVEFLPGITFKLKANRRKELDWRRHMRQMIRWEGDGENLYNFWKILSNRMHCGVDRLTQMFAPVELLPGMTF